MADIKKTLLAIVQDILSDIDSEPVDTIGDTLESEQIVSIVETVFYDIAVQNNVRAHEGLLKLTALADTSFPTHFQYPSNLQEITHIWYDVSTDNSFEYREIEYVDPVTFLRRVDNRSSDYDSVLDKSASTNLRIHNDRMPTYYTSFDDEYIVMDSYSSTVDNTLTQGKTRATGRSYPQFSRTDSYTPDLPEELFPVLIHESTAKAQDLLKGGVTPKVEQAATRARNFTQSKRRKTKDSNNWSNFGR